MHRRSPVALFTASIISFLSGMMYSIQRFPRERGTVRTGCQPSIGARITNTLTSVRNRQTNNFKMIFFVARTALLSTTAVFVAIKSYTSAKGSQINCLIQERWKRSQAWDPASLLTSSGWNLSMSCRSSHACHAANQTLWNTLVICRDIYSRCSALSFCAIRKN